MIRAHIDSCKCLMGLVLLTLIGSVHAAEFEVTGSDEHVWYLLPSPETTIDSFPWALAHHGLRDDPVVYRPLRRFGQKPTAQAAHGDTLWLTLPPRADRPSIIPVQVLTLEWNSGIERYLANPRNGLDLLPSIHTDSDDPGIPVDMVATPDGPAVLLKHQSGYSLQRLRKGRWEFVELPDSLNQAVQLGIGSGRLVLLSSTDEDMAVYWETESGWTPPSEYQGIGPLLDAAPVQDSLMVANLASPDLISLSLVQPGGMASVGTMQQPANSWRLLGSRGQAFMVRDVDGLEISRINLMTGPEDSWLALRMGSPIGMSPWPLILAFAASMMILLIMIRSRFPAELAVGLLPLPAIPRFMALWIDAIPGLIVVMLLWGAKPGLIADAFILSLDAEGWGHYSVLVLITCFWSMIWELLFMATPGKILMGGNLRRIDGGRPTRRRIVIRSLIKFVLLLLPVLMITALRPPALQSAADQATGIVVARRSNDQKQSETSD
ncbi:MAG: hypothetical protein CMJ29_08075 [Phycisphaerae bacterium]|nr:hypothetical protein [Phycisphaerae bacterium]